MNTLLGTAFGFQESELPLENPTQSLEIIPEKNLVVAGHFISNGVTIFDVSSGERTTLSFGANDENLGQANVKIAYSDLSNEIFAASSLSPFVTVIDSSSLLIKDPIFLGEFESVSNLAINKKTNKLYAVSQGSQNLIVIDVNTKTITGKIDIGSNEDHSADLVVYVPAEISVNSLTNQIFVSNYFAKTISVIDGNTNEIIKSIVLDDYPSAVKINELTNELFVFENNSIFKFDGNDWSLIYQRQAVGVNYNSNVSIDPTTNLIYLTDPSRVFTIINGTSGDVEDFVDIVYPNYCVEVDHATKIIYVCTEGPVISINNYTLDSKAERHLDPPNKQQRRFGLYGIYIVCDEGLAKIEKYDGSYACVKPESIPKLVERGWIAKTYTVQSRDLLGMDPASSFMGKITPTLGDFKETLSESEDIKTIISKFGNPHRDIGSGIHIYVYELGDSTQVWIGYTDHVLYARHVDSDGNILENLLEENEN